MRFTAIAAALCLTVSVAAETPAGQIWTEAAAKRSKLGAAHQEFEVTQTYKRPAGSQSSKRQVVLDLAPGKWRERVNSGSGKYVRIFDGSDLFSMEDGGTEYVRTKRKAKDDDPVPSPYRVGDADWMKAVEKERRPCGIPGSDRQCVLLQVPLKPFTRTSGPNNSIRMVQGVAQVLVDPLTGLLLVLQTVQAFESARGGYQSEITYSVKRLGVGPVAEAGLFQLPSAELREVKELSPWNAARMKKQLAGQPAPELTLTDIQGKQVSLAALKGKTVLLDFWTTWCPPCRADAPALDKLYRKYGGTDLEIIGISVSEDRAIVEKFLKEHPHSFPVALTSENDLPATYQIGLFPTYIVINRDGDLVSASEGDKGFGELQRLLKKSGLEGE